MSELQKWCPNYTEVCTLAEAGGCLYTVSRVTPRVSPPLGAQFLCRHQTSLGENPALTQGIGFPTDLPTTWEGWPKATRHENACLLRAEKPRLPLPLPTKTLIKYQETGGTVTHTLQVLHSLQWHEPSKDERAPGSRSHPGLPLLHTHATWCC